MRKITAYLLLLMVLLSASGCCTVRGAATGMGQDVQNISNPDQNGWHAVLGADAWMREHLW